MKIKTIVCSTIFAGLLAVPALVKGEENKKNEQKVAWKDLPVAVQNTIMDKAHGGTVGELEMKTKHGKVIYEADIKGTDGKKTEIKVAGDGKFIKAKVEDDDDDDNDKAKDNDDK